MEDSIGLPVVNGSQMVELGNSKDVMKTDLENYSAWSVIIFIDKSNSSYLHPSTTKKKSWTKSQLSSHAAHRSSLFGGALNVSP